MTQRESRNGVILQEVDGWVPLIKAVLADVGLVGAAVYGQVWCFCQMRGGVCWASLETIAAEVGLSKSTVLRHIKALCDAGYLRDTTPDRTNRPHVYADTARAVISGRIEARLSSSPAEELAGGTESPSQQFGGVSERHPRGVRETPHGVRVTPKYIRNRSLRDKGEGEPPDAADAASGAAAPPSQPSSCPDPSGLTIKEIGRLDLDREQWRALGRGEQAGKKRVGVARIVERKLRVVAPAVEVYREVAEVYPKRALWPTIADAVGDEQEDLGRWREAIVAWLGRGYNPRNVAGMLDWFKQGFIPERSGGDGHRGTGRAAASGGFTPKARVTAANTPTPAQMAADRRALAAHRRRRAAEAADAAD